MIHALLIATLLSVPTIQDLVDAKRWDEAAEQLDTLSPLTKPRFEGLIAQGRGQLKQAAEAFERALEATPEVPELHHYAAHVYLELERFQKALEHAQAAQTVRDKLLAQPLLEARALDALKRTDDAYAVLVRACAQFKTETRPWLELAALAHRQDLRSEVRRAAKEIIARKPEREAAFALFHMLYQDPKALPVLEELAAHYEYDAEMRGHLAHIYAEKGQRHTAASLFEEATVRGSNHAFEAADQYWLAGLYRDALRMNSIAPQSEPQQIQRVAILFENRSYARIVAMKPKIKDPATRYRLAYAHYALSNFSQATDHARTLLDGPYREAAQSLLEAMGRDQTEASVPR